MDYAFLIVVGFGTGTYTRCILEKNDYTRPRRRFIDHTVAAVCFTFGLIYLLVTCVTTPDMFKTAQWWVKLVTIAVAIAVLVLVIKCAFIAYHTKRNYKWDKDGNIIHRNKAKSSEVKHEYTVPENDPGLEEILKASRAISDLCINERETSLSGIFKGYGMIRHHLPLKDKEKHYLEEENWDLTEEQAAVVKDSLKILGDYASDICDRYYDGLKKYKAYEKKFAGGGSSPDDKDYHNIVFKDYRPLPHWIVFPHYPCNSLGWRMGLGESYGEVYGKYYSTLSEAEQKEEAEKYPEPEYIRITHINH